MTRRGALVMVSLGEGRVRTARGWAQLATWACDCGRSMVMAARTKARDCGCGAAAALRVAEDHRASRSPLYIVWAGMRARCNDAENDRYGGRGITVCARWAESFAAFAADVGPRPFEGASLDRIDNDRGYEPGNVEWATATTQGRNRGESNRVVTAFGVARCVAAWSEVYGVPATTISARLGRGWPAERAVSAKGKSR
ncbi:MAG: hypothetical protein JWM10_3003 [Myxococcaceae bacterium]|nr:hypothetical protein [Myxococcaceae bacterium]